ncbi:acyltransferase family protein [Pseudomonas sp. NPDC089534]|uniref:acyltransferase family protein n=1 Tax=Pseudomonas sp. NPDC089534 TaxID=3364468 RepID=UPI00381B30CB
MRQNPSVFPERLYALDALRGIAALAVVFWHWQHFFFQGAVPGPLVREEQPLYSVFALFYRHGGDAVSLFFSLSGFVFFWLFSQALAQRRLSAKRFFVERFSRIYPLHLATFLLVLILQKIYAGHTGQAFVYPNNDAYHAILNVFLAPAWGLEQGWSFNAPAWSVSVEVLLYAAFFLVWRHTPAPLSISALIVLVCVWVYPAQYKIVLGGFGFFAGGLGYWAVAWLLRRFSARMTGAALALACVAGWAALDGESPQAPLIRFVLLFPLTVAAVAACHAWLAPIARRLSWLGDISYATYLLHFPLQIVAALLADKFLHSRDVFYQPWSLLLFLAVLIGASLLCHRAFERPLQRWLRQGSGGRIKDGLDAPRPGG